MKFVFLLSFFLSLNLLYANDSWVIPSTIHNGFDVLLKKYVNDDGKVDYIGFKMEESALDSYLELLANRSPSNGMQREEQLVYWINLYNASTIKLILKHFPVSSIMDIENGKPWDLKWIKVGSETYSLNEIENDIIRPNFSEPRIHMAVNCAAISCPPLMNKAWKTQTLESDFNKRTKMFINDDFYNTVNKENINISRIFEWYKSDFGDLLRFINKYAIVKTEMTSTIKYKEYNWSLNKQ